MSDAQPLRDSLDLDRLIAEFVVNKKSQRRWRLITYAFMNVLFAAIFLFAEGVSVVSSVIAMPIVLTSFIFFFFYGPRVQTSIYFAHQARQIFTQTFPNLPKPPLRFVLDPFWIFGVFFVSLVAVSMLWPNQTDLSQVPSLLALAVLTITISTGAIIWKFAQDYRLFKVNQRSYLRGRIVDVLSTIAICFFGTWLPYTLWQHFNPTADDLGLFINLYAGILIFVGLLFYLNGWLPRLWVFQGHVERADYDAALKRANTLLRFRPHNIRFQQYRITLLLFAGRDNEAEPLLWQLLDNPDLSGESLALLSHDIGSIYLNKEKYEDALPYLETAIRIYPIDAFFISSLGVYYMEQKFDLERGLELMERALTQVPAYKKDAFSRYTWAANHSTAAVVLAMTGRDARANALIEQALQVVHPKFLPGLAAIHVNAAKVCQIQSNLDEAHNHIKRTLELDPQGNAGKDAAKLLAKIEEGV